MKKISNYNDGVMYLYTRKDITTAAGGKRNVKSLEDLDFAGKLPFDEKSVRQQDIEFAEQNQRQLTLKIATPDNNLMDTKMNAVIGGTLYGIIHIDRNRNKKQLFFYLEEVRKIVRED